MKYVVYVLAFLLLVLVGGGWFLYASKIQPMASDHERMKAALPEWDRATAEMRKQAERERWIAPAVETLRTGLDEEIKAGLAEVTAAPNGTIVVNLAEKALHTPGAVTFGQDSLPTLRKLASLLKNLKDLGGKDILIVNTAPTVPSTGTGRRKKPGIDGRELAAKRSLALVKFLTEKEGMSPDPLIAAAGPEKMSDRGFKIKDRKTMIVIGLPPAPAAAAPAAPAVPKQAAPASPPATAGTPAEQQPAKPAPAPQAPIPITPAPQPGQR